MYLICVKLKQLQKLKAVRDLLGHLISLPSPAGFATQTGRFPGLWAISRWPRCGVHHQFPWETISQPNALLHQAELRDVQPKHFFFISSHYFYLRCLYSTNSKG